MADRLLDFLSCNISSLTSEEDSGSIFDGDVYYHTGINYCGYTLEICGPEQQSTQLGYHYQIILSIPSISQEYHNGGPGVIISCLKQALN